MTKYEKETVIVFNEEEKMLDIETPNKSVQRKIESFGILANEITEHEGVTFKRYSLPKKWLHIKKPRQLSSEQRQLYAERARKNFHGGKNEN